MVHQRIAEIKAKIKSLQAERYNLLETSLASPHMRQIEIINSEINKLKMQLPRLKELGKKRKEIPILDW